MPRAEKKCEVCLGKGYTVILGWRHGDPRKTVPCDECRSGRRFSRMWRKASPPTKRKPSPVDSDRPTDDDVAAQGQHDKRHSGSVGVHEGD